jgi:hypothetical protein
MAAQASERETSVRLVGERERIKRYQQAIKILEGSGPESGADIALPHVDLVQAPPHLVRYKPGETMHRLAERILDAAGHPLHIKKIMETMVNGGYPSPVGKRLRTSLVATLDRKVGDSDTFTKPEPATFGLRKWNGQKSLLPEGSL